MRACNCAHWRTVLGFDGMFIVDCEGKKGGLIFLWKGARRVSIKSYSPGHIDSIIQEDETVWRFTGFYGNPDPNKRNESWNLLRRLASMLEIKEVPWLVGGDFNEICSRNEKFGGRLRPENQMELFRNAIEECELREIYGVGEFFTWVNRRSGSDIIFEKLDRFFSTFNWRILYPTANSFTLEYFSSDHRAVEIIWQGWKNNVRQRNGAKQQTSFASRSFGRRNDFSG
ncbi:hypothetical protein DH2020_012345 [Rehmannia glutinosa]|uniref:Endonuclease/exonuclease/phosphatase domain-containing protein n=1 Tax=Rehmannia glutinosa TaxID=99300 RepID=A0ABR0WZH1_REHGL